MTTATVSAFKSMSWTRKTFRDIFEYYKEHRIMVIGLLENMGLIVLAKEL